MIELLVYAEVARPADRVWQLVADYGQDPRWRAGTTMTPEPPGIVTVGTTTDEILRFWGRTYRSRGEVTQVEPGRAFSWRTLSGLRAAGGRIVEPLDDKRCRVTLHVQVHPQGIERALAPVIKLLLRRTLRGDLRRLAHLL